jgi:hypothetical protein
MLSVGENTVAEDALFGSDKEGSLGSKLKAQSSKRSIELFAG